VCIEKLFGNFKSPIWKYFDDLYGYCRKPNFLDTVHHTTIFHLRISQIFVYYKSTNYFNVGNHLHNCLLCVEKLHDNYKLPLYKHFDVSYCYCAKPVLDYCASIIFLLRISQLIVYCKSTNYFTKGNRLNICLLCIEKLYDTFKSLIRKHFDDLYDYCAKPNFLSTAHHTNNFLLRISQLFVYCKSNNSSTTGNRLNI